MDKVFMILVLLGMLALLIGLIKPSVVIRWNKQATRKDVLKIYPLLIFISFIAFGITSPPLTPQQKQKQKLKIEEQKQIEVETKEKEQKQKNTQEYVNKILNIIFNDIARHEKHLQNFSKTLSSGNALKILKDSKQYNYYARKWGQQNYPEANEWLAYDDEDINNLIDTVKNLAIFYQVYYDSIDEYIDNQQPSKLLKIEENLETINQYTTNITIKAMSLANKYNLQYDEKNHTWHKID